MSRIFVRSDLQQRFDNLQSTQSCFFDHAMHQERTPRFVQSLNAEAN
ncbi:MAG TPA: hypothetical protein VII75_16995 [Thermoanaerobaculia bacterium]|nr:hypothetical protein [Thermoanaerobaculia bacterium]